MNKIFGVVLIFVCIILGAVCILQNIKSKELKIQIKNLKEDITETLSAVDKKEIIKTEKKDYTNVVKKEKNSSKTKVVTSSPIPEKKKKENPLAKIMEKMQNSPKMKEAIRKQQSIVLNKQYKELLSKLNLSDDEKEGFMDLLLEKQMAAVEVGMSFLSNGDEEDKKSRQEDFKLLRESLDKDIEDFLGPENYDLYVDYEKEIPYKMQVDQFKQQLPADSSMTSDQETQLVKMMVDDAEDYPNDFSKPGTIPSKDVFKKTIEYQEARNKRILENAQSILNKDQLKVMKQQLETQISFMKMGQALFD